MGDGLARISGILWLLSQNELCLSFGMIDYKVWMTHTPILISKLGQSTYKSTKSLI